MIFLRFKVIKISLSVVCLGLITATILWSVTIYSITKTVSNPVKMLPIYSVETDDKKIAITFDAAWSAEDTDLLIDILKKHNAKATFFVVGDWADQNHDAVKKLYNAGHEIGNHSDTHPAFSTISRDEIKTEIISCNNKIKAITGVAPRLVRAPSGDYDNKSLEVTENLGMKMIQWDVDSLDWKLLSVDEMYNRVTEKLQNGSIVLFHNGVKNTPEALDKILTKLKTDGYEFVTASELIYWDDYEIDHSGRQLHK